MKVRTALSSFTEKHVKTGGDCGRSDCSLTVSKLGCAVSYDNYCSNAASRKMGHMMMRAKGKKWMSVD